MDTSFVSNVAEVSRAFLPALAVLAVLVGLYAIGSAGYALWEYSGDGRSMKSGGDAPIGQILAARVIFGSLFLQFGRTLDMLLETGAGAGAGARASMAYFAEKGGAGGGFWGLVISTVFLWISVIGTLAVFRGLLLWMNAADGSHRGSGDPKWQGFWHIVAGVVAIKMGS